MKKNPVQQTITGISVSILYIVEHQSNKNQPIKRTFAETAEVDRRRRHYVKRCCLRHSVCCYHWAEQNVRYRRAEDRDTVGPIVAIYTAMFRHI